MTASFTGLRVQLGDTIVLRDLTIKLTARTTAIVGDNGSGKSTLARVAGGLAPVTAGTVRVLGIDPVKQAARLRERIAFVFSNPDAQIVMPTVIEDVGFSLRGTQLSREEKSVRIATALERFGLSGLSERSAHDLSGGQKQLLALCGAFVRNPELVIADEPTAYLDGRNARRVADHLLGDTGHRLILVTHDLNLARRCDEAILIANGEVSAAGASGDVVDQYEQSLAC